MISPAWLSMIHICVEKICEANTNNAILGLGLGITGLILVILGIAVLRVRNKGKKHRNNVEYYYTKYEEEK